MGGSEITESIYVRCWHPVTREESGREATSAEDVAEMAKQAANEYRDAKVDFLPGLALWRGVDVPENSLTLGVALDGWAIIYTDEEFLQKITRGPGELDGVCRKIQLDDFLDIPSVCFIPQDLAMNTISFWIATGQLLEAAGFSNDLFTC
jgi:hypothetical protein